MESLSRNLQRPLLFILEGAILEEVTNVEAVAVGSSEVMVVGSALAPSFRVVKFVMAKGTWMSPVSIGIRVARVLRIIWGFKMILGLLP